MNSELAESGSEVDDQELDSNADVVDVVPVVVDGAHAVVEVSSSDDDSSDDNDLSFDLLEFEEAENHLMHAYSDDEGQAD